MIAAHLLRTLTPVVLIGLLLSNTGCRKVPGSINGSVHVACSVFAGDDVPVGTNPVLLPGLEVVAVDKRAGFKSEPCITDLFGRFHFNDLPGGTYSIVWEAQNGWAAGVHNERIVVNGTVRHAKPVYATSAQGRPFCGKARWKDGHAQYFHDPFFDVTSTARVSVMDALKVNVLSGPAAVNAMGWFVLPDRPKDKRLVLRMANEAHRTDLVFSLIPENGGAPAMVQMANTRPTLLRLTPMQNGKVVRTAAPGDKIEVYATSKDADGNDLNHRWAVNSESGSVAATGTSTIWTLPDRAGKFTLYALVSDGNGAYDRGSLTFEVGKISDEFSGQIIDKQTNAPLADVEVGIGSQNVKTDAQGRFRIDAGLTERYVMNATKLGYAPLSKVVYSGLRGHTWKMVPAQRTTVDPTGDIVLTDKRPVLEKEKRRGAEVKIPANALVDENGDAPTGPIDGYIATINIATGESPGDWGAINDQGKETSLLSYGAAWVEFADATGRKFNLKAGTKAQVAMPAPDNMLPNAPASSKFWSYSEKDGYWRTNGQAVFKKTEKAFIGQVAHFSYVNTDIEKNDPACLRILLYPGIDLGQTIRVSFPAGSPYTQNYDIESCDAPLNAVYRLPANTDVVLTLLDRAGNVVPNIALEDVPQNVLPGNVVNTGPPQGTADWRVPEPYEACKLVVMRYLDVDVDPSLFLTVEGDYPSNADNPDGARDYFAAIDPQSRRTNFGAWLNTNGFTFSTPDQTGLPTNPNVVRTSYMNNNDLGSGRDMYFLKTDDTHIAAYVTNYGKFNQDTVNARFAEDRTLAELTATVCMEFSTVEGQEAHGPIVKFFVYFPNAVPASSPLFSNPDLDGFGPKFVPNLCVNCHGAEYYDPVNPASPTIAELDLTASFRELDYNTFKFKGGVLTPSTAQRAAFKLQNQIVATNGRISSAAIKELINGWYGDGNDVQETTFAPTSYNTPASRDLYTGVIGQSCRTCHVALSPDISWANYDDVKTYSFFYSSYVLCDPRIMPHAAITYRNFWTSTNPHRPALLRQYEDLPDWERIGNCPIAP